MRSICSTLGAHEAGELEQRDAGSDRERREGVPQRVGRAVLEAGGAHGWRPLVGAPLVQVQVAAAGAGKEQAGIKPRRERLERLVPLSRGSGTARSERVCLP